MKRILELQHNLSITTECWTGNYLAIIESYPQLKPWLIEKFINIRMLNNFNINYYSTWSKAVAIDTVEAPYIYDEVLLFTDYFDSITNDNFLDTMIQALDNGEYIHITLDHRYINRAEKSYLHNLIVYGYDDQKQIFHIFGADINHRPWSIDEVSFHTLKEAYYNGLIN